jgi:hypothetical protein
VWHEWSGREIDRDLLVCQEGVDLLSADVWGLCEQDLQGDPRFPLHPLPHPRPDLCRDTRWHQPIVL